MAMLWKERENGEFDSASLAEVRECDASNPAEPAREVIRGAESGHRQENDIRIVLYRDGPKPVHALIANADTPAFVNGSRIVGGIRVLQHRDELTIGSQRMFFSAESAPIIEPYLHDGAKRRPRCAVCRGEVLDGQSVVRCPGCLRIYHQIAAAEDEPEKPCWTYQDECRFCNHPTSMSGEPTWRPDEP